MDEFLIQLQAELDEAKSKGNINSDIDKIQDQIDKLKIQAEIDPKTISSLVRQLETVLNRKINISTINIDSSQVSKQANQAGQQIGNNIAQGITSGISKSTSNLKSFSDLKLGNGNISAIFDEDGVVNAEKTLNKIKQIYSEFGQVKITNQIFDAGELQEFKVNIQQVNGDLKETRSFIMALSADGKSFTFPSDIIKGSESIVHHLNEAKNATTQIATEADKLAEKVNRIQFSLNNGEYSTQIEKIKLQFQQYGLSIEEAENKVAELHNTLDTMQNTSGERLVSEFNSWQNEIKNVKVQLDQAKLSYDKFAQPVSDEKITSLIIRIQDFLSKNTAITREARTQLNGYINELNGGNISLSRWNEINLKLKETESEMRGLGRLGKNITDQFKQAADSFSQWLSVSAGIMFLVSQTKNAVSELKELDNILTEISKTSDLTNQELKELGLSAYDTASTYGRTASDYLSGVQSMSQSGFYGEQGEAMARQSLLAQAAGDMSQEIADKYILATNAAYKFNGEAEKLNAVLDGQNSISNRNSVSLQDMAEAMSEAGTVASSYRVSIEDLSAMIGTIESVTKTGGSEVGNSIKSILVNLQNVSSSKIVNTLNAANASMTEMVDGTEQLRDPISILRDLAKTFNELDESDPLRAEILTNVAGKYQASKLAALLQNMELYDKILVDYSEGSGSAMIEAQKSATNLTGSINTLSNSWTELVNTFIDSDSLKTGVNILNDLVQSATGLVDILTPLGTLSGTIGSYFLTKNGLD